MSRSGSARSPFSSDRLARLLEIEATHFWFSGRRDLVEELLGRIPQRDARVLDLGVGGGLQTERLSDRGYAMTAVDFLPEGIRRLNALGRGILCVQSTAESLAFAEGSFDLVLALDVLEHTDDEIAVREIARVLRPGGIAIVTVPAYSWLWSVRDDLAGHRRRYTRGRLRATLDSAQLRVLRSGYYQCLLFPMVVASRAFGRRDAAVRDLEDTPPHWLNVALGLVNRFEVAVGTVVRWPFGSSTFAVAAKPAGRTHA